MAGYLVEDCPHCRARHVAFEVVWQTVRPTDPAMYSITLCCPVCTKTIGATVKGQQGRAPSGHAGDLRKAGAVGASPYAILEVYPSIPKEDLPADVPTKVLKQFSEGCEVLKASPNGAAALFRRCLEIGLREIDPNLTARSLQARIDKLADDHKVTPALKDWAHRLRLDGNEAVHGDDDVDEAQAIQMRELTRYLLLYLFTLPAQIKKASDPGQ